MLRFPSTPQFRVHYKSIQSKVNAKTLQINPESDRSSVSCLWYHFPSKWYGWGSDNCHPDLASLHHSPKTHQILQGGRGEITNIHNLLCLSKNTSICQSQRYSIFKMGYFKASEDSVCLPVGLSLKDLFVCLSCMSPCITAEGDNQSTRNC